MFAFSCFLVLCLVQALVAAHPRPAHGHTREFDFIITWEKHAPDGFSRDMLLINGQSPGPVLEVDQDDWVVVRVHNLSPYNTTLHFHGIEMSSTPWSDGVPGVTQRPILPGSSFEYKFEATQYGSYWYHSHFRGQIEDGLYGPIVIHPRHSDPKPFHFISEDASQIRAMEQAERDVVPLVISDFTHLTSDSKWEMTLAAGFEDSCYDSILFNGKGSVQCLSEDDIASHLNDLQRHYLDMVPHGALTDKACFPPSVLIAFGGGPGNETALLPGAFYGCENTKGSVEVVKACESSASNWTAIDIIGATSFITGVVSIDEHDMWVYAVDGNYIEPQKVQAITLTNGDRYSVLVRTSRAGDFKIRCNSASAPQMMVGHAMLSVGNHSGDESRPFIDIVGLPLSKDVIFFNQSTAYPYPPDPIRPADVLFPLSLRVDGASYLWAMNSSRLMPIDVDNETPILFDPKPFAHNNVTISTQHGQWVDLVFATAVFPMPAHPIHKHGTKMYQIGSGTGPFKWPSVEEAVRDIPEQFNLVNPPRRDAFSSVPAVDDVTWMVQPSNGRNDDGDSGWRGSVADYSRRISQELDDGYYTHSVKSAALRTAKMEAKMDGPKEARESENIQIARDARSTILPASHAFSDISPEEFDT
ncbi:hypothetical protein G7046_g4047 [Stylonectria norvegica]|nr:hypothetical protein G7046_g4047 [Stylonectria norvegica]